jgi:hypothetical protein
MRPKTESALSDWLKTLATNKGAGELVGFTTREAAKAWGVCRQSASQRIDDMLEAGQILPGKAPRTDRVGVVKSAIVYLPVKAKRK